ncbi:hypothetical protein Ae717Ps2_6878 [Pseudonocardia sp. Ae717_Ps2]|nr:hypothetical protein Ae717Ps2_7160c [Pseudonocardia sp. Ae717_Ps2]OLM27726.1 hypothetical protein Ae717Ps2_7170c [Pseudonocardia sp. Ae717_Ps2]OLM28028.1 hypothetical protein Ae717Ps2_6878 [Pseudonocardia sp. Ae717_Ps2]
MVPEATCTVCESPGTRSQTRRHGFTSRSTNSRAARSSARCLLHMISAPVVKTAPVREGVLRAGAVVERGSVAQRAMRAATAVVTATPTGICTWWWTA